jgi:DNA-binding transcriptional MerR regulator
MMTVHEVSERSGVSIRTLQYYDKIGLLRPAERTEAGYRLYCEQDLVRLQQIMLYRELEFPLKDIKDIVDSADFDRARALQQQIELLELKREHISRLIDLAKGLKAGGDKTMSFEQFDTSKMDEYAARAKASWGKTSAWKEYEAKSAGRTKEEDKMLGNDMMALFVPFGRMAAEGVDPACEEAIAQAKLIQDFITGHYYRCTDEIFAQLGNAYGDGGEFTHNINHVAGEGAAEFASRAVKAYVASRA